MGREATCTCVWNGKKSIVKALIEPPELILRGELKRRVPIATMKSVKAERDQLCFTVEGDPVALSLGSDIAVKWADALLKPPPTLARKLGHHARHNRLDDRTRGRCGSRCGPRRSQSCLHQKRRPDPRSCRHAGRTAIRPDPRHGSTQSRNPDLVHLPQAFGAQRHRPPSQRKLRPHHRARHRHRRHKSCVRLSGSNRTPLHQTPKLVALPSSPSFPNPCLVSSKRPFSAQVSCRGILGTS